MGKYDERKHMVDVLFMIALFCVFAVSALILVIIGADVYRKTVKDMDVNYNSRTAFSYITEKIRQNDTNGCIQLTSFGGSDAIEIKEHYNDTDYVTYLYLYDGYLCELGMRMDSMIDASAGDRILRMDSMQIEELNEQLYRIELTSNENENYILYVSTHSKYLSEEGVSLE